MEVISKNCSSKEKIATRKALHLMFEKECAEFCASRTCVPYVSHVPMCLTCSRVLRTYLPSCFHFFLRALRAIIFLRALPAFILLRD